MRFGMAAFCGGAGGAARSKSGQEDSTGDHHYSDVHVKDVETYKNDIPPRKLTAGNLKIPPWKRKNNKNISTNQQFLGSMLV